MFGEKEWSEKDEEAKALVMTPRPNEVNRYAQMKADNLFAKGEAAAEPEEVPAAEAVESPAVESAENEQANTEE